MTTATYLVLDPAQGAVTVTSAGHPPPLVIAPDGRAGFLDLRGGVALGVSRAAVYREERFALEPGSTILLYTDGVVEVRGESLDDGLERLRLVAERGHLSVAALCDAVIDELVADGRPTDDAALVAVRIVQLGDRLVTRWPARLDALVSIRDLLRRWLAQHGASEEEAFDIIVACQEACANAIEHAYGPGEHVFEIEADADGAMIEVRVRDHGQWRASRGVHRGRGLPLMEVLMDSVQVERCGDGTTVVLRRAVSGMQRS
jgi:anti-sigma regulatory factor (Ser/Thr protein kinase)